MKHQHIIKSLPLLASVLGRKYGVQVRIGGDTACTNGNIIQLPALPVDSDNNLLNLLRGFLDHEAAHIRDTDFEAFKQANLSPFEKYVWNSIEDWRVENKLAALYPGCRKNFHWLIRHLFLGQNTKDTMPQKGKKKKKQRHDPAEQLLNWLLMTARSWDVAELQPECEHLKILLDKFFPDLTDKLKPILDAVRAHCPDTVSAIIASKDITSIIRQYLHEYEQQAQENGQNTEDASGQPSQAMQSLQDMLASTADNACSNALGDMGTQISEKLSSICHDESGSIRIAVPTAKRAEPLSLQAIDSTRLATTALRVKIQALLQSQCTVRNRSAFTGTLNTHKLHTLATGNTKLFMQKGERIGMNTAIHILLDRSGSMSGKSIQLASQACFAVASALHGLHGMNVGVTAFPGLILEEEQGSPRSWQTVLPIMKHGQKLHTHFDCNACGSTPMDAALWWVVQQLHPMAESRKIILIMTDGKPDDEKLAQQSIDTAKKLGFELYGIGIGSESIAEFLPSPHSRIINDINELAGALFSMLQNALVKMPVHS